MEYSKDLINAATWIVCPACTLAACDGKFECDVIKKCIDLCYSGVNIEEGKNVHQIGSDSGD